MEKQNGHLEGFIGISIYIFITILLGGFGVIGGYEFLQANRPMLAGAYLLLVALHIGLHWLNLKWYAAPRWQYFYYGLQTILIVVLALFPYADEDFGVSLLGSAVVTMIGEALGIWGNTRRAFGIALFYAILLIGSAFSLVDVGTAQRFLSAFAINGAIIIIILAVLNRESTEREKAEMLAAELEQANLQLAVNAAQIEELALAAERQRMARELHDTLAQGVAGLVLQLEAVKAHLAAERSGRAAEIVGQALARARGTLADSRSAIDDLRADPASLSEAVRGRVKRFTQATGIPCDLELVVNGENGRSLPEEIGRHALQILSEALVNVTRHAQAIQVSVRFVIEDEQLALTIQDNGRGFDPETMTQAGHYGLLGMRERARLMNGTLAVESSSEQGTTIRLQVPL
ncbi:MAG: sensor histidine kinase [Chloroflexota bacterium]